MKVIITLGPNSFEADGEFSFDEGFTDTLRTWINAQFGQEGLALSTATQRLKQSNKAAADTVTANTP